MKSMTRKELNRIIDLEVTTYIWRNISKKVRVCLCGCGKTSHRIPGYVKRIIDARD